MIRINQIKMFPECTQEDLIKKCVQLLHISKNDINNITIVKKSIDARNKNDIKIIYSVDIVLNIHKNLSEKKVLNKVVNNKNIMLTKTIRYNYKPFGIKNLEENPIIIGAGPAGLFCGLYLARNGYNPVIIERGSKVEERINDVESFWETGKLNIESNIQFGEGGAGTFSDGKLNTAVNDKYGRNMAVLKTFVEFGAPKEILYESKPHIGTDLLINVVKNMRKEIIKCGGKFYFNTRMTNIIIKDKKVSDITLENNNKEINLPCNVLVLAIGHSSRDTFRLINKLNIDLMPKSFAVGVRIEHNQSLINKAQYGELNQDKFGAAPYKLTTKTKDGRGVYSFCMCPGGYVVNASSEKNRLVVNGMSYYKRDSQNANSGIIVTVSPNDFLDKTSLGGMHFQEMLEEKAYAECGGKIPVQKYIDFKKNVVSNSLGNVIPCTKGKYAFGNINNILPQNILEALKEGIDNFATTIKGFNADDSLLLGVESRTSSPVRICRDDKLESNIGGIYPCGEGAGYAGGITSAAIDGIKIFEAIADIYKQTSKI